MKKSTQDKRNHSFYKQGKKNINWVKKHPVVVVHPEDIEIDDNNRIHWTHDGVYQGELKSNTLKYIMAPNCSHTERIRK